MMRVYPSLLCAKQDRLYDEVMACSGADGFHVDIMDGHFVPYLACNPSVVGALKAQKSLWIEAHFMVQYPQHLALQTPQADAVTLHTEQQDPHILAQTLQTLRQKGHQVGLALNPETSVECLEPFWSLIDHVLVMTVTPGKGGQVFQENQLSKIRSLRQRIRTLGRAISLKVDGGINDQTARLAAQAGADTLIMGSYLFKHQAEDYPHVIQSLQALPLCF